MLFGGGLLRKGIINSTIRIGPQSKKQPMANVKCVAQKHPDCNVEKLMGDFFFYIRKNDMGRFSPRQLTTAAAWMSYRQLVTKVKG